MSNPCTFKLRSSNCSRRKLGFCLTLVAILSLVTTLFLASRGVHADPSNARLAILNGISYNQADRSVSIVLELTEHRPFTLGRLDAGLYVDIENTKLSPALLTNGARLPNDSLVQVKTRQLRKDTARVVFQFDAIAGLQAVPLKNPSRILFEIYLPKQPSEARASLSASPILSPRHPNRDWFANKLS